MVPLVFKTSLGVVRLPEGSTPSLLRQERFLKNLNRRFTQMNTDKDFLKNLTAETQREEFLPNRETTIGQKI